MEENLAAKMQELLSDPESMQQISELAAMFKGSSDASAAPAASASSAPPSAAPPPALPDGGLGIDPAMLMQMGELLKSSGAPDKNAALLLALKPHLREARQQKVDKALRLLRLWSIWQVMQKSGMLQKLL